MKLNTREHLPMLWKCWMCTQQMGGSVDKGFLSRDPHNEDISILGFTLGFPVYANYQEPGNQM